MEAERETIDRYVAAWLAGRVGEVFDTRATGVQEFGLFATIIGLGGDGLVPISTLGAERFAHDEKRQVLVGEETGEEFAMGTILKLRLAEANPLTGALKFEPVDLPEGAGRIEPRAAGVRLIAGRRRLAAMCRGRAGRPRNIRHQGASGDPPQLNESIPRSSIPPGTIISTQGNWPRCEVSGDERAGIAFRPPRPGRGLRLRDGPGNRDTTLTGPPAVRTAIGRAHGLPRRQDAAGRGARRWSSARARASASIVA
jgi:hypothetical protein